MSEKCQPIMPPIQRAPVVSTRIIVMSQVKNPQLSMKANRPFFTARMVFPSSMFLHEQTALIVSMTLPCNV